MLAQYEESQPFESRYPARVRRPAEILNIEDMNVGIVSRSQMMSTGTQGAGRGKNKKKAQTDAPSSPPSPPPTTGAKTGQKKSGSRQPPRNPHDGPQPLTRFFLDLAKKLLIEMLSDFSDKTSTGGSHCSPRLKGLLSGGPLIHSGRGSGGKTFDKKSVKMKEKKIQTAKEKGKGQGVQIQTEHSKQQVNVPSMKPPHYIIVIGGVS
jgi:hypothetical protein